MSIYDPKEYQILKDSIPDLVDPVDDEWELVVPEFRIDQKRNQSSTSAPAKFRRKGKPFRALIMLLTFGLMILGTTLAAQPSSSVSMGMYYTDNAFQLSDYDLQRNETGSPALDFVKSADDVVLKTSIFGGYQLQYKWWKIQPELQLDTSQNFLNPSRQRFDALAGLKIKRRLGELGLFYVYTPETYIRSYIDTDGTGKLEDFSYARNLYRANLRLNPLEKSSISVDYRLEQYYYDRYFTEFDGDLDVVTLSWQQNFPLFYLDGGYGFKDFNIAGKKAATNPEDASYEANVWSVGALIKKMPLDPRYPGIQWRPELDLRFETRYYQGTDHWHAGRTDNLNTTTGTLHFYFGDRWNLNLDYSHLFRNVDALASDVIKIKEFNENRFGLNVRYQL